MKDLAIIIPALGKNEYHEKGDLASFGDVSLFQWKLTQVEKIDYPKTIYISTSSDEIAELAGKAHLKVIRRDPNLSLKDMIAHTLNKVQEELILWTHVTSPFIGSKTYRTCLDNFVKMPEEYDSLLTVHPVREYIFYNSEPINFDPHKHVSRRTITPALAVTNGCFVISREKAVSLGNYMGDKPLFHELDKLASMEIKDVQDMSIANDLLAFYMKKEVLSD